MPPKRRSVLKRNVKPPSRRRRKRAVLDEEEAQRRRRAADALWRADMTNSFNVLRRLLPPSSLRNRRSRSRLAVLQATEEHVHYLETVVCELLEEGHFPGDPESLEAVRQDFYDSATAPARWPGQSGRRSQRCSEPSSQELQASLEDLEEQDPAVFTGVREPSASVSVAADSAPSSPTLCQAWLSNRAVEAAVTSSPTVRSLMESFYDDIPLPTLENNVVQLVPGAVAYEVVSPSDPDDDHLVPIPQLYEELIAVDATNASTISAEDFMLSSSSTVPGANSPERLATSDNEQNECQLPEQWFLATHMKWILNSD